MFLDIEVIIIYFSGELSEARLEVLSSGARVADLEGKSNFLKFERLGDNLGDKN